MASKIITIRVTDTGVIVEGGEPADLLNRIMAASSEYAAGEPPTTTLKLARVRFIGDLPPGADEDEHAPPAPKIEIPQPELVRP